ncbi:MAG: flavodoxin family protein [Firmicutes bacterium]|nr:flavodoxin family protein [Bacillota bacterium]
MKVLMLNGSVRKNGNTNAALLEIAKVLKEQGIDSEIFEIKEPVRDCIGCGGCTEEGCRFTDDNVNEFIKKAKEADGFVFGTPVYYAHPSGRILSFLDRAFYSGGSAFRFKPAAAVACARRAGTTASFDVMNKYFGISNMITVGSTYWNVIHGRTPGEALFDAEGVQTMHNLANNMAWILKCIDAANEKNIPLPNLELGTRTNFIR